MFNLVKKFFLSLCLISAFNAQSQVTLSGFVLDQKSKEPLFGVNIFIPELTIHQGTIKSPTFQKEKF